MLPRSTNISVGSASRQPPPSTPSATASPQAGQSGSLPSVSLPTGGGSITGMGDKFKVNPADGTGSLAIPIVTSAARHDFGPALSLTYNTGCGNGPFGLGWELSTPSIARKTSRGLPRYVDENDSDVFLLAGMEDLVPVFRRTQSGEVAYDPDTGNPIIFTERQHGYIVRRYAPRIESSFVRIERWTKAEAPGKGQIHWRVISGDNTTSIYGRDDNSRIFDPECGSKSENEVQHTFSWLLSEQYDCKGNAIIYEYKAEDSVGVESDSAHERHRSDKSRSANRYLKLVRYGNRTPNRDQNWKAFSAFDLDDEDWLFSVAFDYGDINMEQPRLHGSRPWLCRRDPFSSYRPGFEVRTYRLCRGIVMFHHFPEELGVDDYPVAAWSIEYEEHSALSYLKNVGYAGYLLEGDGLRSKHLPPVSFAYSEFPTHEALSKLRVRDVDYTTLANVPAGVDEALYRWIDLDGEGIPGILYAQDGGWLYKHNLSACPDATKPSTDKHHWQPEDEGVSLGPAFGPTDEINSLPSISLQNSATFFGDVQGNGLADLVCMDSRPSPGFFSRDLDRDIGWNNFRSFESIPANFPGMPAFKFIDLTGDGLPDILMSDDAAFIWYPSLGEIGYGEASRTTGSLAGENLPALLFSDPEQSVYLADMSGDGLTDLVCVRNGQVCYWPNLGYCRFGRRILMDNSPWFDTWHSFNRGALLLADIDGSGTTDLVHLGADGIEICLNESGNRLGSPKRLPTPPPLDSLSNVSAVDLFGNGTSCLVWSSRLPGQSQACMKYIDFMGGQKPHLLNRLSNNCGAETRVHYAPSTKFYLQDKAHGRDWVSRLPFPVQVVEKVEVYDEISHTRFVSRYAYHHGYYDGYEREFRGFAAVDQWDTEDFETMSKTYAANVDASWHAPPVHSKSWFHTGLFPNKQAEFPLASEFFAAQNPEQTGMDHSRRLLADSTTPRGLDYSSTRESYRALKGSLIRTEVYADDNSDKAHIPYFISENNYIVRIRQPQYSLGHSIFTVTRREQAELHMEREPSDPRIQHDMTLQVDDYGHVLKSVAIAYGRQSSPLGEDDALVQQASLITYTETDYTNMIDTADDYRLPLPCEARSYEVSGLHLHGFGRSRINEFENDAVRELGDISYEHGDCAEKKKRLIRRTRFLFRSNDLAKLLPLSQVESMAIEGQNFNMAFTPGLLGIFRRDRTTPSGSSENLIPNPVEALGDAGAYVDLDGNGCWWIPSTRSFFHPEAASPELELAEARKGFFAIRREVDPFGNTREIYLDRYNLLSSRTVDALGNTSRCIYDYRILQPRVVYDLNGNRTAYAYDEAGMAAATAVMGKDGEALGDSLDGFILPRPEEVRAFFTNPRGAAAEKLLGNATTRTINDLDSYWRGRDLAKKDPIVFASISREAHVSQKMEGKPKFQLQFSYVDGLGRTIQTKIAADPTTEMQDRWATTGWTVLNNKGSPVRRYEPFYDDSHEYRASIKVGTASTTIYDPLGRAAAVLSPNHCYKKSIATPWQQEHYDFNDTVLWNPKTDPDIGPLVCRFADDVCLPTWFEQRRDGGLGPEQETAAKKSISHADTPRVLHYDPLGREFLTVEDNGDCGRYELRVTYDVEGRERDVVDEKGRVVRHLDYDMAGTLIHEKSMEAAERWVLTDAGGEMLYTWDSRRQRIRKVYDRLRRPVETILQTEAGKQFTVEKAVYGESLAHPEARNARGRLIAAYDQAGITTQNMYDFKGDLVSVTRRLARTYKGVLDWSGDVALEAGAGYTTQTMYDALGRQFQITKPDRSVVEKHFNQTGGLRSLRVRIRGEDRWTRLICSIEYNAKGQRTRIKRGNGAVTTYDYDPFTDALTKMTTRRPTRNVLEDEGADRANSPACPGKSRCVQDLHYAYDPAGNIISIRDAVQETVFYNNQRVSPAMEYTYDPLYRLVEACGREHLGSSTCGLLVGETPREVAGHHHPNDASAMARYRQHYTYDEVGNILAIRHEGAGSQRSWTRRYFYDEPSILEPGKKNNRLSRSTVGSVIGNYAYDHGAGRHGCVTSMPGLPTMQWDYRDQLCASARQTSAAGGCETTYYVYDATGERVRKATERQGCGGQEPVRLKERLYVGIEAFRRFDSTGRTMLERETLAIRDDEDDLVALVETRIRGEEERGEAAHTPRQLVRYQLLNHQGSVSFELDEKSRVLSYEEYTPYGSTSYKASGPGTVEVPKRYGYAAKERDEESGLYYYGARYYAAAIARWTSCDPSGLVDGANVYVYVRCNPVRFTDADGRMEHGGRGGNHPAPVFAPGLAPGPAPAPAPAPAAAAAAAAAVAAAPERQWSHRLPMVWHYLWIALGIDCNATQMGKWMVEPRHTNLTRAGWDDDWERFITNNPEFRLCLEQGDIEAARALVVARLGEMEAIPRYAELLQGAQVPPHSAWGKVMKRVDSYEVCCTKFNMNSQQSDIGLTGGRRWDLSRRAVEVLARGVRRQHANALHAYYRGGQHALGQPQPQMGPEQEQALLIHAFAQYQRHRHLAQFFGSWYRNGEEHHSRLAEGWAREMAPWQGVAAVKRWATMEEHAE